ncbi:hypothetical protein [Mesorhizobium sp.]|uniref:hypothetical protein n=1 Tax=Mesorhizobium sp. TaxID=1871066 RepID=UPI0025E1B939|nr:hypothetical protein [Mesorhizobium sp.]
MVWDYYDGVRTGIADLNGAPHYFASQFDDGADEYSDNFKLYPVGPDFMQRALRYWSIYRAWEHKYHNGKVHLKTHPGRGGVDVEYVELRAWLDDQVEHLLALPSLYRAEFHTRPGQEGLAAGILRQLEVSWSPSSEQRND